MTAFLEHVGIVYLPLCAALLARALHGKRPRSFAACLLSMLWVATTLPILQRFNLWVQWWRFTDGGMRIDGLPLDLYAGWLILWGLFPPLAFPRLAIRWSIAVMAAADLLLMPLCTATLQLRGHTWLWGEAVGLLLVLLPALCLARWTASNTHLRWRSAMQVAISGMLFLYLIPDLALAKPGWGVLLRIPALQLQLGLQVLLLLAIPGISAVWEFAERGNGTPIPYDPPQKLVTSGIYRYLTNPMQTSCALVMLLWAAMLRSLWLMVAVAVAIIYSSGIAWWDEREDLTRRFGDSWLRYRREVHNWRPRWRPFHAGEPARLYIASSCEICSGLRRWLEARRPIGLEIRVAELLPAGSIERMRYDIGDGATVDGVRALGRALEHLDLLWAVAGCALRLPIVWQMTQLLADNSGAGPRKIPHLAAIACALQTTEPGRQKDVATL